MFSNNGLLLARHLHLELCHIARNFNFIFGTHLTIEMASYLIYLMILYYDFAQMILNQNSWTVSIIDHIGVICWTFIFSLRLYALNYICESVSGKVRLYNIDKHIYAYRHLHIINNTTF